MVIVFWLLFSVFVAMYAHNKGRGTFKALLVSLLFSPLIGFIVVALLENQVNDRLLEYGDLKKCPSCAELVKSEALKCKHCGTELNFNNEDLQKIN